MVNIKRSQGFSLLEVLVAFSILALSLGVILEIFARGNKVTSDSHAYAIAVTIAESKLASIKTLNILSSDHQSSGTELEIYDWELSVTPYFDDTTEDKDKHQLYKSTVVVRWGNTEKKREVELNSLRLLSEAS